MNSLIKKINPVQPPVRYGAPRTLRFVDHYEHVHGFKPLGIDVEKTKPAKPEESKANKQTFNLKNQEVLPVVLVSFLTSTALAIGAHTTSMLDRFGDFAKGSIQTGLNVVSVISGMIATESMFPFSK